MRGGMSNTVAPGDVGLKTGRLEGDKGYARDTVKFLRHRKSLMSSSEVIERRKSEVEG